MTVRNMLLAASGAGGGKTYIEDVFSTYLYTGNGSTQTITNGINLSGKGGLVWSKSRDNAGGAWPHALIDTARGVNNFLSSNQTDGNQSCTGDVTSFNTTGITYAAPTATNNFNRSGTTYVNWTFAEKPKFFDVVTYTGNGSTQTINHNLGSVPGMMVVKCSSNAGFDWMVYHRSEGASKYLSLNGTSGSTTDTTKWNNTAPTATQFSVGLANDTNANGYTYVAYLFAHDTSTDGLIQCGSFTTDGSGNATVSLGWEPQWILYKATSQSENWWLMDTMRGWDMSDSDKYLMPNLSNAEGTAARGNPTSTGFTVADAAASATYIYVAVRRGPMRTPTSGTSVYSGIARTGTGSGNVSVTGVGFPPDMALYQSQAGALGVLNDKLRGAEYLLPSSTQAGTASTVYGYKTFLQDGAQLGSNTTADGGNASSTDYANWFFRRAPGFFDVVCYTGTGATQTVAHNLGVAPELMIVKIRSGVGSWAVYSGATGNTGGMYLNLTNASAADSSMWNNTSPTSSAFTVGTYSSASSYTYVAYLFASCPGVSKVGTYTGNGSSQTINCGFSAGARFVLIKRTDNNGDWYVWDSARGIVASNDPHLSLNDTAAEVTTDDSVDADNTGFIVNQNTATNVNVNTATYIYLAIA